MAGVRRAIARMGESVSPARFAISGLATAGLFVLGARMRKREEAAAAVKSANGLPFVPAAPPAPTQEAAAGSDAKTSSPPGKVSEGNAADTKSSAASEAGAGPDKEPDAPHAGSEGAAAAGKDAGEGGKDGEAEEPVAFKEDRPENDRDPFAPAVYKVVYDSFDELVIDGEAADLDVVVHMYQEGCMACSALAPRTRMIAKLLAGHSMGKRVRVCMINATANNPLPPTIESRAFPRLVVFPKGAKDSPVAIRMLEREEGGRRGLPTVLDILELIEATSGTRFRVTPQLRAEAQRLEAEAETLNSLVIRAGGLTGMHYVFNDLVESGPASDGMRKAWDRFGSRAELAFKACESLSKEGAARQLDSVVGKAEMGLAAAADQVDTDSLFERVRRRRRARLAAAAGKEPEADPSAGVAPPAMAMANMLMLQRMRVQQTAEDGTPECAAMCERSELRIGLAMATLAARLEDARPEAMGRA
ncbi:hypothetical protein FNF27_02512 [Cafeteria roenbergensis]|uniref:Thioredoxin domain-containing protein n=2 Tax=Cafeteria roenbergensis TaxID=33653 RepID=A0A5A8EE07_CAFRO|nr:hypothetical protein FNF27_02512 [Cafeteria roenbergensis]